MNMSIFIVKLHSKEIILLGGFKLKQPISQIYVIQVLPVSSTLGFFQILLLQLLPPSSLGTCTVFGGD